MLAFNKALLAKQAWRLIDNPSSLIARVFKAKYFKNTNFLEARSYQTSSYAWRSIIQTQALIRRGIKWVDGNGDSIVVWKDNWLPGEHNLPPQGPGAALYPNLKVNDLFIPGTTSWDMRIIYSLFCREDALKILSIRPSLMKGKDIIMWKFRAKGIYTVKKATMFKGL